MPRILPVVPLLIALGACARRASRRTAGAARGARLGQRSSEDRQAP